MRLLLIVLLSAACRGDVAPFEAEDRPRDPDATLVRLTYSTGDDQAPEWSATGDSVYYAAEAFGDLPDHPGVLVGLPREGGVARPILQNVQTEDTTALEPIRWFVAPALSPEGERVAYAEVDTLWPANPCPGLTLFCNPARESAPLAPLRQMIVRVRRFDATGPLSDDPAVEVPLPGVSVSGGGTALCYDVEFYPFQRLFEEERALTFRVSWSPDGERLVFSDGLQLWIWTVGDAVPVPVPNTEDGVWAAWSPDGDRIAYTRLARTTTTDFSCSYPRPVAGSCADLLYSVHQWEPATVMLVDPDGGDPVELGPGSEPAWSPDGQTLFVRRADAIWRVPVDGDVPSPVPDTEGGREPAVAPDGSHLAFTRTGSTGDYDVWVTELDAGS